MQTTYDNPFELECQDDEDDSEDEDNAEDENDDEQRTYAQGYDERDYNYNQPRRRPRIRYQSNDELNRGESQLHVIQRYRSIA
jgi:hypothetical protein